MSDVKAQSVVKGVLRLSGAAHKNSKMQKEINSIVNGEQTVEELIERRANWEALNAAQRNQWVVDAITLLLSLHVKD